MSSLSSSPSRSLAGILSLTLFRRFLFRRGLQFRWTATPLTLRSPYRSDRNVIAQFQPIALTGWDFVADTIQEISLPPGTSVQMDGNAANVAITVSFRSECHRSVPAHRAHWLGFCR